MSSTDAKTEIWEERWQQGRTGWDQQSAHPALVALLSGPRADELGVPKSGRAVVPGCGRGYDVQLLAERGLDTLGIDLSPTGVEAAKQWLSTQRKVDAKAEIVCDDVFAAAQNQAAQFDVILDYTFLCALPPSMRPDWRKAINAFAKPTPGTLLLTLMFPLNIPEPEGGYPDHPPYPLSLDVYHEMLDEKWELVHHEPIAKSTGRTSGPAGDEAVGVWRWKA